MSAETRDLLLLAIALLTMAGSAYYFVVAVLDGDRLLSRSAALAFFVFGVVAAVFFARLL